jgi:hypothetical protein
MIMLWFKDKLNTEVDNTVATLEELKRENEELKARVKGFENILADVNSELTKAKPVLDFDTMRIFSIERMANDNKPCTVIGYFIDEPVTNSEGTTIMHRDVVHQWYLYCNNERHEEIVANFIAWKAKK